MMVVIVMMMVLYFWSSEMLKLYRHFRFLLNIKMTIVRMVMVRFLFLLMVVVAVIMPVVVAFFFVMMMVMIMRMPLIILPSCLCFLDSVHFVDFFHDFFVGFSDVLHRLNHLRLAPVNIEEMDHVVYAIIFDVKVVIKPNFAFLLLFSPILLWFEFEAFFQSRKVLQLILFVDFGEADRTGLFHDVAGWAKSSSHTFLVFSRL